MKKPILSGLGLRVAKAVNLGPLRINLSGSGVGGSIGGSGLRIGIDARGTKYVSILGRRMKIENS